MIIQNAVKLNHSDGKIEYIKSRYRHDFRDFTVNGYEGFIDGGDIGGYLRRSIFPKDGSVEDYSLSNDSPLEEINNKLLWGHYSEPNLKGEFLHSPIKNLTIEHLEAILEHIKSTIYESSEIYKFVIEYWIKEKTKK